MFVLLFFWSVIKSVDAFIKKMFISDIIKINLNISAGCYIMII